MKNIPIIDIEKKLNKTIKKDIWIIAFDSSEHSTGIALIKTTDKSFIIEKTLILEVKKTVNDMDAIDLFIEQLDNFKKEILGKYKFNETIIENVFIGLNPKVGLYLARIGILVYDRFKGLSNKIYFRFPNSARAIINFKKSDKKIKGKELKQELINYINKILNTKVEQTDIADSLILALSGAINEN